MPVKGKPVLKAGSTILLIEPAPYLRSAICELLEVFGYRVLTASNRETALQLCVQLQNEIDCLIVAAFMLNSTGLEVVDAIREAGYQAPALLYSVFEADQKILKRVTSGEVIFLPMPFSPGNFRCKIKEAIRLAQLSTVTIEQSAV